MYSVAVWLLYEVFSNPLVAAWPLSACIASKRRANTALANTALMSMFSVRINAQKTSLAASREVTFPLRVFQRAPYRLFGSPIPSRCCRSTHPQGLSTRAFPRCPRVAVLPLSGFQPFFRDPLGPCLLTRYPSANGVRQRFRRCAVPLQGRAL